MPFILPSDVVLRLSVPKFKVFAAFIGDERIVVALLDYLAVIEDDYLIAEPAAR